MEFLQLTYFKSAAVTNNFSITAKEFLVPTSAVSISIKNLETELGAKLFDRTSNKISLNSNGRIFFSCVEKVFDEIDDAKRRFIKISAELCGNLSLLLCTNSSSVANFIAEFKKEYPLADFTLDSMDCGNYKNYDIIVTDKIIRDEAFSRVLLIKEKLKLAAKKSDYALFSPKSLQEMKEMSFISLPPYTSLGEYTQKICREGGFTPKISIRCSDIQLAKNYIKMGLGVAFVPEFSWRDYLDEDISLLEIPTAEVYRSTYLYRRKSSSVLTEKFSEKCLKQFQLQAAEFYASKNP